MKDNNVNVIEIGNVVKRFKAHERGKGKGFLASFTRKRYTKTALAGASVSVRKGEIVALLGMNGSGKSTLVKIMTGILFPDEGEVRVLGMDPWNERIALAKRIGVVLGAHGQLYWNLPALDTFEFMKHVYKIPDSTFNRRLRYFIGLLNLKDVYKRQVRTMSLGEQMKCNFVASVLHMPELVVLDEPTIGVDLPSKSALREAILEMQRRHATTFLMTTHIVEDISVASRIVIINAGKVVFDGPREKLEHIFGDKKQVSLEVAEADTKKYSRYGKVIEKGEGYIKLEVDRKMLKQRSFVRLLADDSVLDYSVAEPNLTYVLSKLYSRLSNRRANGASG